MTPPLVTALQRREYDDVYKEVMHNYYHVVTVSPHLPTIISNRPLPFSEIRKHPSTSAISWETFKESHKSICQLYYLCISEILSDKPISLNNLPKLLRFQYSIPLNVAEQFLNFISTIETNDIIFEEPLVGIRQPLIRLRQKDFSRVKPLRRLLLHC